MGFNGKLNAQTWKSPPLNEMEPDGREPSTTQFLSLQHVALLTDVFKRNVHNRLPFKLRPFRFRDTMTSGVPLLL